MTNPAVARYLLEEELLQREPPVRLTRFDVHAGYVRLEGRDLAGGSYELTLERPFRLTVGEVAAAVARAGPFYDAGYGRGSAA